MRLDVRQRRALDIALKDIDTDVYLFGSRVDDSKKGGDIDILIFSKENAFELSKKISTFFFMECEEKIDVVVMHKDNLTVGQQSFLDVITMEKYK